MRSPLSSYGATALKDRVLKIISRMIKLLFIRNEDTSKEEKKQRSAFLCYLFHMRREEILTLLYDGFTHSIKDPLWGNIPMSSAFKALLENKDVQKLARIKQNGPTYHIYPGSVHTRLDHSIGVYHLSRMIILSLATKNEELPLSRVGIMSFLASGLLHDIGHFPYAHSLKELAIREHEEIAADMILNNSSLNEDVKKTGADPFISASIIDKNIETDDEETALYRMILSGPLDPDKLDYLSRDAYFSGVPYGTQNTDYIIKSLDLRDGNLVLEEEALVSIEHVLFSKYMMYRTVYWHKGVRSATAMIKKALLSALRDKVITYEDLYLKDDIEFSVLAERYKSYEPFVLIERVEHNNLLEKKVELALDAYPRLRKMAEDLDERMEAERMIFSALRRKYRALKEYETIIDIPEPVNFESSMLLLRKNGEVTPIREDESVLSREVGMVFSSVLRKLSIFLPHYVSFSDAVDVLKEMF